MYLILLKPETVEADRYEVAEQFDMLSDAQDWIKEQDGAYFGSQCYAIAEILP